MLIWALVTVFISPDVEMPEETSRIDISSQLVKRAPGVLGDLLERPHRSQAREGNQATCRHSQGKKVREEDEALLCSVAQFSGTVNWSWLLFAHPVV